MNAQFISTEPSLENEFAPVEGEHYVGVLARLHDYLKPSTYLEIGSLFGSSLALAHCKAIAIDPGFQIQIDVMKGKPSCHFFQCTSDQFFKANNPSALLGAPIDFAFLDGMHLYEFLLRDFINVERHCLPNSIIALHDCVPADRWMAQREHRKDRTQSHCPDQWTGDVWKCLPILKKYRPDLSVLVLDAAPTGLVLVTNLDPTSRVLPTDYAKITEEFGHLDIGEYGVRRYQNDCRLTATSALELPEDISRYFWL